MLTYVLAITLTALLGLFVNENRLSASAALASLYVVLMILVGWWQDWPAQLASNCTMARPVLGFLAAKILVRFIPKGDERFSDSPLSVYFFLNIFPASEFLLNH